MYNHYSIKWDVKSDKGRGAKTACELPLDQIENRAVHMPLMLSY